MIPSWTLADRILSLTTIGTPHEGSPITDLVGAALPGLDLVVGRRRGHILHPPSVVSIVCECRTQRSAILTTGPGDILGHVTSESLIEKNWESAPRHTHQKVREFWPDMVSFWSSSNCLSRATVSFHNGQTRHLSPFPWSWTRGLALKFQVLMAQIGDFLHPCSGVVKEQKQRPPPSISRSLLSCCRKPTSASITSPHRYSRRWHGED